MNEDGLVGDIRRKSYLKGRDTFPPFYQNRIGLIKVKK